MAKSNSYIVELVSDPDFQEWILNPSSHLIAHWNEWMANDKDKQDAVKVATAILTNLSIDVSGDLVNEDELFERIKSRTTLNDVSEELNLIKQSSEEQETDDVQETFIYSLPVKKSPYRWFLRVAASILLIAGSYLFYQIIEVDTQNEQVPTVQTHLIKKSNPAGQKSEIRLTDGSVVYLNSESTITYTSGFSTNRTIHLEGEAFFEVAEDAEYPFTVIADDYKTVALGTSFNVRAYKDDPGIQVSLITGKVKVSDQGQIQIVELTPGQEANSTQKGLVKRKSEYNPSEWKDGVLRFNNTDFDELVVSLERWYGVDIDFSKAELTQQYTATFRNSSLERILESLSYTAGFKYEIKGKNITIK